MSNIIDSIQLSGVTYTISAQTSGGTEVVEITQANYDALVSGGTVDPTVLYIITDAQAGDLTQYWTSAQTQSAITQATSGKVNTSSVVSSVTSASTDSEIPTAKAVWEAASGGSGASYTAGRGIDITNSEISVSLPISAGTDQYSTSIKCNTNSNVASGVRSFAIGMYTSATTENSYAEGKSTLARGTQCHAEGENTSAFTSNSHSEGYNTLASGNTSHAEGWGTKANGNCSHAEGQRTITTNQCEHASGNYNVSTSATTTFGDSGNTLFSVGNGTADNARHNAFEIRQNGDIYLTSGSTDIKLQDYLGGGGSSINVVQTTGSSTTDVMSQAAVTNIIGDIETLLSQI